jgi:lysozyme family protein
MMEKIMNEEMEKALINFFKTLENKVQEIKTEKSLSCWQKTDIITNLISKILIPIVIVCVGWLLHSQIKTMDVETIMTSLAIDILKEPPVKDLENKKLRTWAVEVINNYSKIKLPEETKDLIIQSKPLVSSVPWEPPALSEYNNLFKSCRLRKNKKVIEKLDDYKKQLIDGKERYIKLGEETNIPWFVVGIIHLMETDGNFQVHLHNNDPLSDRTVHFPEGRPLEGDPPFSWEESAVDALKYKKIHEVEEWTIEKVLFQLEAFNGWGYRKYHPNVNTPYLWAGSNLYTRGSYTADGSWDDNQIGYLVGAAVLLKFAVPDEDLGSLQH